MSTKAIAIATLVVGLANGASASIVGVKFGTTAVSPPSNWTLISSTASPVNNLMDETGAATVIDLAFAGTSQDFFDGVPVATSVPNHTNPLGAFAGNTFDSTFSETGTFTATFSDLTPGALYDIWVFGARFGFPEPLDQNVTISGGGAPIAFSQGGAGANDILWVNNAVGSSLNTLESYALSVLASAAGQIMIDVAPTAVSNTYAVSGLAINPSGVPGEVPEAASIAIWGGFCVASVAGVAYRRQRAPRRV